MLPALPNPAESRLHISGSIRPYEQIKPEGDRDNIPYQYIVLGDRDVVGVHSQPDTLLHLRGESPRLAGALTPLLPCAPEQTGKEMDKVNMKSGWDREDVGEAIISDGKSTLFPLGLRWLESLQDVVHLMEG